MPEFFLEEYFRSAPDFSLQSSCQQFEAVNDVKVKK